MTSATGPGLYMCCVSACCMSVGIFLQETLSKLLEELQEEECHRIEQHKSQVMICSQFRWNTPSHVCPDNLPEGLRVYLLAFFCTQEAFASLMACARASHAHEVCQKCLQECLRVSYCSLQGGRRASGAGTGAKGGTIAFGRREETPARVPLPSGRIPASSAKSSAQKQPSRVPKAPQPSTQKTGMPFILHCTAKSCSNGFSHGVQQRACCE